MQDIGRSPHGTNVGRTDSGGDVVVARRDVCSQGSQRVERRLTRPDQIQAGLEIMWSSSTAGNLRDPTS